MQLFRSRRRPAPFAAARNWRPTDAESAGIDADVGEFTQLALWMSATLAGLVTAALLSRRSFFENLARQMGWMPAKGMRKGGFPQPPTGEMALPLLADAIVGSSRNAIASVFGPPRCAVAVDPASPGHSYWKAETWYYPMPDGDKLALVIRFQEDHAAGVRFLVAPVG